MHDRLDTTGVREFLGFTIFALALKAALDLVIWRYAGPISLVVVLACIGLYLAHQKRDLSTLGIVPLKTAKNFWLIPVQTLVAFVTIIATGAIVSLLGDASGLEFMQVNTEGARDRFGDLAGNTSLFLMWLAILWVAGPAEELFFRGFMINTLTKTFGTSRLANAISILIPALIFGAGHMYYQGVRGLFTTGAIGVSLGCLFLAYKRNIWPLMVAHACVNSLVFTLHYLDIDA
ncbi:MAG: CPBP family intramembrane glutamic endopeptidase [Pseudomonadota bacterium]